MKNKLLSILLVFCCSLVLFGCDTSNSPKTEATEKTQETNNTNTENPKTDNVKTPTESANPTETPIVTENTETVVEDLFTVQVVYPDNTPVTTGVTVQWCEGEMCYLPQPVNSNGLASIELEDGEYYIHLNNVPQGYTYNPNAYTTNTNNKNIIIPLYKIGNITGEGSKTSPYVVEEGTYNVNFEAAKTAGMKYFSFTATEAGTYEIESFCMDKLAMQLVDPYLGFVGTDINSNPDTTGNDIKDSVNFKRSFEAEANTTYYFIIMISSVSDNKFPCLVEFNILKK